VYSARPVTQGRRLVGLRLADDLVLGALGHGAHRVTSGVLAPCACSRTRAVASTARR
jgi:hypothetical protein